MLDVDDMIEGGELRHRKIMAEFRERFKSGKYVKMKDLGAAGTLVPGRRLQQHADSSFTMNVQEYAERKCDNVQ
eukprot:2853722-Alexandrium_andersonii.AAC.1